MIDEENNKIENLGKPKLNRIIVREKAKYTEQEEIPAHHLLNMDDKNIIIHY